MIKIEYFQTPEELAEWYNRKEVEVISINQRETTSFKWVLFYV